MKDILLTVDTEGPRGDDPIKYQIWGYVNGVCYGIPKIIELCDKYCVRALFFVDIAEAFDYGYIEIANVIKYIKEKGHDVGVHIHPHHIAGESRQFLYEYTKEEQRRIITDCTKIYEEITGERPISFRAGKYGANRDTLEILQELGYKYDFSEFYLNKWCGIKPEVSYVLPQKVGKLIEIPVTIFKSFEIPRIYKRYDKLEICESYGEIVNVLRQYLNSNKNGVIVLFLHSFSLLNWIETPNNPRLNKRRLIVFEKVLRYISTNTEFNRIDENSLSGYEVEQFDSPENIVKTQGCINRLWYSFLRVYRIRKYNNKAKVLFGIAFLITSVMALMLAWLFWR